jgi:prepilin-type N-terminal cleavage/methylation domain-containing protein
MRRTSRRGFTIIELLVVMAILLILISLVVVGARVLSNSGRTNQTRTLLQSMAGVTKEFQLKAGPTSPVFSPAAPANVAAASYLYPMVAPGDVTADGGAGNRTGSNAILATASVMLQAQAIPDVQTAMNSIPVNQLTSQIPPNGRLWVWVPNAPYRAMLDFVLDNAPPTNPLTTPPTESVYQCIASPLSNPTARPALDSTDWQQMAVSRGSTPTRIPLDAWGNPMIFVPASGLSGVVLADGQFHTITSPDGQPFWASAGPDGNFSYSVSGSTVIPHGDDNVYSFQK